MAEAGYANFDIRIIPCLKGYYAVTAESDFRGIDETFFYSETKRATLVPLPTSEQFAGLIAFLRGLVGRPEDAKELGKILREFLFPKEVWDLYLRSLAVAQLKGKQGLRIRVRIGDDSPELSQIPWEYCRDDQNSFLALNKKTPLVRYLPSERPSEPPIMPRPVRILLAMASPQGKTEVDVVAEEQWIRAALKSLIDSGHAVLEVLPHATRGMLRQRVTTFDPHILYFLGHGEQRENGGVLILEDAVVDADALDVLLQNRSVRLVVLTACESSVDGEQDTSSGEAIMGIAPRLVSVGIPAVVGMQFKVPYRTAVAFTREFFELLLVKAEPLDTAVTEARIGTYFDHDDKVFWAIPVLFMRSPDGVIWQPAAPSG